MILLEEFLSVKRNPVYNWCWWRTNLNSMFTHVWPIRTGHSFKALENRRRMKCRVCLQHQEHVSRLIYFKSVTGLSFWTVDARDENEEFEETARHIFIEECLIQKAKQEQTAQLFNDKVLWIDGQNQSTFSKVLFVFIFCVDRSLESCTHNIMQHRKSFGITALSRTETDTPPCDVKRYCFRSTVIFKGHV